jgi:hypothetical protein
LPGVAGVFLRKPSRFGQPGCRRACHYRPAQDHLTIKLASNKDTLS